MDEERQKCDAEKDRLDEEEKIRRETEEVMNKQHEEHMAQVSSGQVCCERFKQFLKSLASIVNFLAQLGRTCSNKL